MERRTTKDIRSSENWKLEAQGVIDDIKEHVLEVDVLDETSDHFVYLNLTTIEGQKYCLELSKNGFRIVGRDHNDKSEIDADVEYFETPYSLLNGLSLGFRRSFAGGLMRKLEKLQ